MSSISNIPNQFPNFQNLIFNTPFAVRTQQFQAQAQTSTTSNFTFTTAEGDRVSLSTGSASQFSFESYNFLGLAEGQAVNVRSQQLSTSEQSHFNLLIEGDLNEQELADIQAFLHSSKSLLQELAAGNDEHAAETALSLSELDSLSSASLFFQQTTSVSLAFRSTDLAVQENDPTHDSQGRGPQEEQGHGQTIENFLDKIQKAQDQFHIDPEKLGKRIPRLLSKLVETLGNPVSEEGSRPSLFDQIRQALLPSLQQSLQEVTSAEETPEDLTEETHAPGPENSAFPPTEKNGGVLANRLT